VELVKFPANTTPEDLADNFAEYAHDGNVKWCVMAIVNSDDTIRFEWSRLPSNLAAIGLAELLKQHLAEQ
jgi:hypothetical protein